MASKSEPSIEKKGGKFGGKEEVDAENFAKRKKEDDQDKWGTIPDIRCVDWSQTDEEVTVVLDPNRKLAIDDIDAEFSDTEVHVKLKGGATWQCYFNQEIDCNQSRAGISKKSTKVMLRVKKKTPRLKWKALNSQTYSPIKTNVTQSSPAFPLKIENTSLEKSFSEADQTATKLDEHALEEKNDNIQKINDRHDTEEKDSGEHVMDLLHVKHDFFEKQGMEIRVSIFVKSIIKDSVKIKFKENVVSARFKTTDARFLSMHQNATSDTSFEWNFKPYDSIDPDQSKYKLTGSNMELILKKQIARRWGTLEAPLVKSSQSLPSLSTGWTTASKTSATMSAVKSNVESSKILFDEISTEKSSKVKPLHEKCNIAWEEKENEPSTSKASQNTEILEDSNKDFNQKPTCMVPPLNKNLDKPQLVNPGNTGLDNLGNTCFMNSVLQVLANTRELRDYFLDRSFQKEVNAENPLGSGGRLAVSFAVLMKVLWSGKHYSYAPAKLKNIVAMKASQFTGFAQHDAQEFMAFLLDGLHEDLNRIYDKPYTQTVDSDGRPDEMVANEAWDVHKKRNDSLIVDLFQGQYKSTLVCPVCGKISITFDPFMMLPVPLPKKQRLLSVIFISKDPYKKPIKYLLRLPQDATVERLKLSLKKKTGVSTKDMRVFEVYKNRILTFFGKETSLATVSSSDKIFICEVLSEAVAGEPVVEVAVIQRTVQPQQAVFKCTNCKKKCEEGVKLKRCTRCFKAAYCNQNCQKQDWQRHKGTCHYAPELVGQPFIVSLPESQARYSKLCQMMEAYAMYSVNIFQPPVPENETVNSSTDTLQGYTSSDTDTLESPLKEATRTVSSSATCTNTDLDNSNDPTPIPSNSDSSIGSSSDGSLNVNAGSSQNLSPSGSDDTGSFSPTVSPRNDGNAGNTEPTKEVPTCAPMSMTAENIAPMGHISLSHSIDQLSNSSQSSSSSGSDNSDSSYKSATEGKISRPDSEKDICSPIDHQPSTSFGTPSKFVVGHRQETEHSSPLFFLKPCDKEGKSIKLPEGERLSDKGDESLDLRDFYFLAMDWKNNDKAKPYVLVQSRVDLDYEEDGSMRTSILEENSGISLDQCLSLFTEPEVLSPEHAWYCPKCKDHREATKQLSIWRLPHTLIIQLKRFSFRNLLWRDKIDKMVEFPTRELDLGAYFVGNQPLNEPPPIYDLYGVINHHGGILGGHYTAFGRCPDPLITHKNEVDWRLFDDSMVSSTTESHVVSRAAYVLFFRRRNHIVDLPKTVPTLDHKMEKEFHAKTGSDKQTQNAKKNLNAENGPQGGYFGGGDFTEEHRRSYGSGQGYTDMDAVD